VQDGIKKDNTPLIFETLNVGPQSDVRTLMT